MPGLRLEIEFSLYLLSCLIAIVSFVYINYAFAKKPFNRIINILTSYIGYFFKLLLMFFLPWIYIVIIARFPSSAWACNDAAVSLMPWFFIVLPCFIIFNITLFIILIIKILWPKKERQPKLDSADAPSE
jgi:hypothetical protein